VLARRADEVIFRYFEEARYPDIARRRDIQISRGGATKPVRKRGRKIGDELLIQGTNCILPDGAVGMQIIINGERRELSGPRSVRSLLEELGVDGRRVAVEVNGRIIKRAEFDETSINDGDRLEVVHFVGGG